ncbi:hypothetical protein AVEN_73139-1, partial [Araneus ventricosus]
IAWGPLAQEPLLWANPVNQPCRPTIIQEAGSYKKQ